MARAAGLALERRFAAFGGPEFAEGDERHVSVYVRRRG
jgi:hypothetical protein